MPGGAARCNACASARGITESIAPWISSTGMCKCAMVAMGANSGKRMPMARSISLSTSEMAIAGTPCRRIACPMYVAAFAIEEMLTTAAIRG